jgi:hypothetical protein
MSKGERFPYVVARRWNDDDANSALCCYSHGGEVQHGTIEEAEAFRQYVLRQQSLGYQTSKKGEWKIFKLVEIPV